MNTVIDWTRYDDPWDTIGPEAAHECADIAAGRDFVPKIRLSAPLPLLIDILGSEAVARRVLAALEAAGYVCVPRVATPKMLDDAYWPIHEENGPEAWEEMVNSALAAQAAEVSPR